MSKMEQNSGESRSGEAMSIFGQSIHVRRPVRSMRRRATQKRFSPAVESPAIPSSVESLHQRRAVAERERARAESELSRASSMANELERQIEQANSRERSHSHSRSELHETRAGGSGGIRRKKGHVDVEAPGGADQARDQSNSLYVEVMQELDRVKRELRKLQREVKASREATTNPSASRDAETPTPRVSTSASRRFDSVNREADDETEVPGIAEFAKAGVSRKDTQATWTRGKGLWKDTSRSSGAEERFATASSSDVGIEPADEMAMVPAATDDTGHTENPESALTITRHEEEHDDRSSLQAAAAEAELTSARVELESIREEGIRFTSSVERTRQETARVTEEIDRLTEQEKRASAQVQQLNARLLRARSKLDAATAADERASATLAELSAALRRLGEETEAAVKERALTEMENRCVGEDAETIGKEIAAAERRVRGLVKELEAARASEAAATAKLRAVVDGAMKDRAAVMSETERSSGNVAIRRFEYEYLTGRAEVVRAIAEKKVAAAEAWAEALRAGEREVVMRAEAIERETGEMVAAGGEEAEDAGDDFAGHQREPPRAGLQRARTRKRAEQQAENELPVTSRKTGTPSSSMAGKPSPASFRVKRKKRTLVWKYLKRIAGKCRSHS